MTYADTLVKVAMLPQILEAASLLYDLKLSTEQPAAVVKRYVEANPDINATMAKLKGD